MRLLWITGVLLLTYAGLANNGYAGVSGSVLILYVFFKTGTED